MWSNSTDISKIDFGQESFWRNGTVLNIPMRLAASSRFHSLQLVSPVNGNARMPGNCTIDWRGRQVLQLLISFFTAELQGE
jgi:hypothetical protein